MMVVLGGRERTFEEYAGLLLAGGWRYDGTVYAPGASQNVVAATAA